MRVVHVITSLAIGGAETALFRLVTEEKPASSDVTVICLSGEAYYGPRLRAAGIPLHTLDMQRGRFSFRAFMRLVGLLRRLQPDLVQTWLYHSDFLGLLAARLAGISRVVWNIRCSVADERHFRRGASPLLRLLARMSAMPVAVISNSVAGQDLHASIGYHPRRWEIIPNGIDTTVFRPEPAHRAALRSELGLPADAALVGLIARYDPLKDHATFLRSAQHVLVSRPETHFLCAGQDVDGNNATLMALARELDITARLHLLGPRSDIARINAALDVAVCSSIAEGFPNILIEAMACGAPCVSTEVGDARLIIGDSGLIVAPRDARGMAEAIGTILADTSGQLREKARERALSLFSLPSMRERYRTLYRSLVPAGR